MGRVAKMGVGIDERMVMMGLACTYVSANLAKRPACSCQQLWMMFSRRSFVLARQLNLFQPRAPIAHHWGVTLSSLLFHTAAHTRITTMARARNASGQTSTPTRNSTRAATSRAKAKAEAIELSDEEVVADTAGKTSPSKRKSTSKAREDKAEAVSVTVKSPKATAKSPKRPKTEAETATGTSADTLQKTKKAQGSTANGVHADGNAVDTPQTTKKARKSAATGTDGDVEASTTSLSAPPPGGSKMDTFADEGLPKNLTIPDPLLLSNTPKPANVTRITSWNILSFKSSLAKGLMRYLEAEDADIVIMTETKCNEVPMHPRLKEMYPYQTWGIGKTKGYAGIAMLCKTKPLKVTNSLPGNEVDTKGRIITAEFEKYYVIGTYVVNAGEGLKTLEAKRTWQATFAAHLAACNKHKPTIWGGDLNVVLDARDLSNASKKWNKSAGYTQVECDAHRQCLEGTAAPGSVPSIDVWRERHPDAVGHYSYYGFRGQCRQKGIGWRLDTFIVPAHIADQVQDVEIRHEVYGASDHLPVYIDIKGNL